MNLKYELSSKAGICVLIAVLFLFASGKLFFLMKYHMVVWDESVYIGMGKYIYSAGTSGLWESIRPPGLPLLLGLFWRLGVGSVLAYEVLALAFSAGVIIATYLFGREFLSPVAAAIASAFLAFSPVFFIGSSNILTDVPSLFFSMLSVYFFARDRIRLSALFAAAAVLFRFPHILIGVSVIAAIALSERELRVSARKCIEFAATFFMAMFPFLAANYFMYRQFTSNAVDAALRPFILGSLAQGNLAYSVQGFSSNLLFYFSAIMKENIFLLFFIPGALFILRKRSKAHIVLSAYLVAYLAYFTLIPNKQERFLISFLPAVVLLSSYWLSESFSFMRKLSRGLQLPYAFMISFILVLGSFAALREDYRQFSWVPHSAPRVVSEVYGFFNSSGLAVMTTDPVFSSFSDNLFIPMYDSPEAALSAYDSARVYDYAVYSPDFFPCENYGPDCEDSKKALFRHMAARDKLVLNRSVDGRQFFIFSST